MWVVRKEAFSEINILTWDVGGTVRAQNQSHWTSHCALFKKKLITCFLHFSVMLGTKKSIYYKSTSLQKIATVELTNSNHYPFFTADIWLVIAGKAHALLLTLKTALFYSSVPVSDDNVTVRAHAQYQHPETEAAKWISDINFTIYLCFSNCDM